MTIAADPLVSTKLRPSLSRSKLVARPRLVENLARKPERRVTVISAPAGFGKTTLLTTWANNRRDSEHIVAWLSLDERDNEPTRFLSYVVAALGRTVEARFGTGILAALRSPQPLRLEALTTALINELAELPGDVSLILDDYHLINSGDVHGIVSFLLDHLPPNLHLIVSGRSEPPLPISRLRARGQLAEIGAADLAFTNDETKAFLRGVMGLEVSDQDIVTLEERTEGWVAGLQLAALSLQGHDEPTRFVESFSGSHRDIFDFLAEEVLARQPEIVREFLLATSILDGLTGSLCDALTSYGNGQSMLERLDKENLFVVALDDERRWYRYHHLFRDFLRSRLKREHPEIIRGLHIRAFGWYEANGFMARAIEYALAAPDHERAVRLIEQETGPAFSRGDVPSVLRWLEALPIDEKRRRPRLLPVHALALALTGQPAAADPLLQEAERIAVEASVAESEQHFLLGSTAAVRSWCARLRGDVPHAVELARQSLANTQGGLRAFASVCLGDSLWTTGDLAAARVALTDAASICRAAGQVYAALSAMTLLARVQAEQGHLREASATLHEALRFATEQRAERMPAAGAIHIGLGALAYERNELDEAEHALSVGRELAELTMNVTDLVWGSVSLSRVKWARRDEAAALELAVEAERVARDYGADPEIAIAHGWITRLRLARGDLAGITIEEHQPGTPAERVVGAVWLLDQIASVRLLQTLGRHREALERLDELREAAIANERGRDLIEIMLLRALTLWALNSCDRAIQTLIDVLPLTAPEGYIRIFADEGQPMAEILTRVLETQDSGPADLPSSVPGDYVKQLLTALERDTIGPASPIARLPESLSEREFDVLRLIAAGKANREIATDLFITEGTVKTHLNNLYRKLDVHSRTQALVRARELGLL